MRELISQFGDIIESVDNILIISHNKPDGDTLGANLALRQALIRKVNGLHQHEAATLYQQYQSFYRFRT